MRFLLTFFSVLLIGNSFAQNLKKVETYYDAYTRTKIHEAYTVINQPPYLKHGTYHEYSHTGKLMREVNFSNGKRNGKCTNYFTLDGYYCKGQPAFVENFKNDALHGIQELYHCADGAYVKIQRTEYTNGVPIAEHLWYSNGNKKSQIVMNGPCGTWYENGQQDNQYSNLSGEANGAFIHWYKNGTVASSGQYLKGKLVGEWKFFYENGQIQTEKSFYYDSRLGWLNNYAINGNLKDGLQSDSAAIIKYVKAIFDSSQADVILALYEQTMIGHDHTSELVNNGEYNKFYSDGVLFQQGYYVMGSLSGKIEEFYHNGIKKIDASFKNGNKDGIWTYYDESGNITDTETYTNGKLLPKE